VLDNLAKALSIVLLNKDIESIQQRQDSDMQALRDEVSRVHGLNQWFLGIMIPMAISVVGL
jgi:adenylate kinase